MKNAESGSEVQSLPNYSSFIINSSLDYKSIRYFPGLPALRFIAAFLVVMHHSESIKRKSGIAHLYDHTLFRSGSTAVSFFFVLSGFLITYLLLKELAQTRTISIGQFYKRRVLRIWPLYYLLVALGLFIPYLLHLSGIAYKVPYSVTEIWYYYVFFMPFMVNLLFAPGLLDPLWSIGVEELFYLMWAPLVKLFHRWLPWVLTGVVLVKTALLTWARYGDAPHLAIGLIETLQFEAMAIGGLGACWLYHRKAPIQENRFFTKWAQVFFFGLILVKVVGYPPNSDTSFSFVFDALLGTPVFSVLLVSGLFLWLILNISTSPKSFLKLENRSMRFLGEISYGIYMYHLLVVSAVAMVLKGPLSNLPALPAFMAWYALVGGGTIVVAWLSKRYFEDFFLRFK